MNRIAECRIARGISQRELAAKISCSRGNISDYESERIQPSLQRIVDIANALEESIDYLIGRSNDVGLIQTNANLTEYQHTLLTIVNQLPHDDQFQVLGFAQALAQR